MVAGAAPPSVTPASPAVPAPPPAPGPEQAPHLAPQQPANPMMQHAQLAAQLQAAMQQLLGSSSGAAGPQPAQSAQLPTLAHLQAAFEAAMQSVPAAAQPHSTPQARPAGAAQPSAHSIPAQQPHAKVPAWVSCCNSWWTPDPAAGDIGKAGLAAISLATSEGVQAFEAALSTALGCQVKAVTQAAAAALPMQDHVPIRGVATG